MKRMLCIIILATLTCGCAAPNDSIDRAGYDAGYEASLIDDSASAVINQHTASPAISQDKPPALETTPPPTPKTTNTLSSGFTDFFSQSGIVEIYNSACEVYDFKLVNDLARRYLEENSNISNIDSVHRISDLTNEAIHLMNNCTIEEDKVEKKVMVYYASITEITEKYHLVSYCSGSNYRTVAGFEEPDWIFFDQITISGDNVDPTSSYTFRTITDVLDGKITEHVEIGFDEEEMENLKSIENPMIRFKNEDDGKHYDYPISQSEIDGICNTYRLSRIYAELSNMRFHWERD